MHELAIISGSSNTPLAVKIAEILNTKLIETLTTTFNNGECRVEIKENVRNKDVFVIQGSSDNTNTHLMELLLLLDALKRSSCYRVTVVLPCYPYSRQDRKIMSRVPISAKLVAELIQTAGADRILTADLHSPQISGFFDIPVDDLHLSRTLISNIQAEHPENNICIISPDLGGVKRAKHFAGKLGCGVAMIYKQRTNPSDIGEMCLIGDVTGKHCIIVDDMVDSGKTLIKAANLLLQVGNATSAECYCVHPVLSNDAVSNIRNSNISSLYVTDTIYKHKNTLCENIKVISSAPLFAEAISGINAEISLSYLFDN